MNFYEQLFCRGKTTGEGMTHFERLFAAKFGGSPAPEIREYTGAVPVTIIADGTPLLDYLITGNTTQSGTPSPTSPVMPQGTGNKTANLFDKDNTTIYNAYFAENGSWNPSTDSRSILVPVSPNTEYTLSISRSSPIFRIYETILENPQPYSQFQVIVRTTDISSYTFTTGSNTKYIGFQGSGVLVDDWFNSLMLNLGSTALPYQPHGYKIPILSSSTTTPVYLGDVQTTRKIKKRVLDGTETITEESANVYSIPIADTVAAEAGLSTHFEYDSTVSAGQFRIEAGKAVFGYNDTLANFSTFLAAQYAAGTPVTVWYVLAESETGIVNEPLMRIGDYADTLSKSQAGVEIPTNNGSTTVDVDTTLKPSEVYIKYMG